MCVGLCCIPSSPLLFSLLQFQQMRFESHRFR